MEAFKKQRMCHGVTTLFIGATPNNILKLSEYEKLPGCVGIKIFMGSSTGELLVQDTNNLFEILSNGKKNCSSCRR